RAAFPLPCPQGGGCPQASPHPATTQDEFDFRESRNQQPANSLSLFSPEAVQTTATVAIMNIVAISSPKIWQLRGHRFFEKHNPINPGHSEVKPTLKVRSFYSLTRMVTFRHKETTCRS